MTLKLKKENQIVPSYSLTGDLISFLRCGLQYRYYNGSSLPPSRPVQLWFGEFIHGVMENAYRIWRSNSPTFPWPSNPTPYRNDPSQDREFYDIGVIGDIVESGLRAGGKNPRNEEAHKSAYRRAERAVNELGPDLFPLIESAEEKVIGTRNIPISRDFADTMRATQYELHGVIDVLTNVSLGEVPNTNIIRQSIQKECGKLTGNFEVIVDYKGTNRPLTDQEYWNHAEWQVQTYSWLRTKQRNSLPVVAGVLLYISELSPSGEDLVDLKKAIKGNETDVVPKRGSRDESLLNMWRPGSAIPNFSSSFRLARAIRVIPITENSSEEAAKRFDEVVINIEECVDNEASVGRILNHWNASGDEGTCVACDFRHICPSPAPRETNQQRTDRIPTPP